MRCKERKKDGRRKNVCNRRIAFFCFTYTNAPFSFRFPRMAFTLQPVQCAHTEDADGVVSKALGFMMYYWYQTTQ